MNDSTTTLPTNALKAFAELYPEEKPTWQRRPQTLRLAAYEYQTVGLELLDRKVALLLSRVTVTRSWRRCLWTFPWMPRWKPGRPPSNPPSPVWRRLYPGSTPPRTISVRMKPPAGIRPRLTSRSPPRSTAGTSITVIILPATMPANITTV